MSLEEFETENGLDILLVALLDDLTERSNSILSAAKEGRVDEKETIKMVCKNIVALSEQIKSKQKEAKEGLELIMSELDKIRALVEECRMNPRSLVADQHLIMEARVRDQLIDQ